MRRRSRGDQQTHLVGVVYSRDVAGGTRALSVSRRYCGTCHKLCLAVRGLAPDVVQLVDAIRADLHAGVDIETHDCTAQDRR